MKGVLVAAAASLVLALLGTPWFIKWLVKKQYGQFIRDDGPTDVYKRQVVVMEAKTGKLRAVAPYPSFDPTDLENTRSSALGNKAFEEVYDCLLYTSRCV